MPYCRCSREGVKILCRGDRLQGSQAMPFSSTDSHRGRGQKECTNKRLQEVFNNKSHLPSCKTKQPYAIYLSSRESLNSLEEKTTGMEQRGRKKKQDSQALGINLFVPSAL